nr:hypothetical protein Iba_chr15aCG17070 [Ipomoea batatas]
MAIRTAKLRLWRRRWGRGSCRGGHASPISSQFGDQNCHAQTNREEEVGAGPELVNAAEAPSQELDAERHEAEDDGVEQEPQRAGVDSAVVEAAVADLAAVDLLGHPVGVVEQEGEPGEPVEERFELRMKIKEKMNGEECVWGAHKMSMADWLLKGIRVVSSLRVVAFPRVANQSWVIVVLCRKVPCAGGERGSDVATDLSLLE